MGMSRRRITSCARAATQPGDGQQLVDLLYLLGVWHHKPCQPAGGDHGRTLAQLVVQTAQDCVDRARVAEHDARADRVDRVLADHALRRREVDLWQTGAPLGERLE